MKQSNTTEIGTYFYYPHICSNAEYCKQKWIENKKMEELLLMCVPLITYAEGEGACMRRQVKPEPEIMCTF